MSDDNDKPDSDSDHPGEDRIIIGPPAGDGRFHAVRHHADHSVSTGTVALLEEGKAIHPETEILQIDTSTGPAFKVREAYKPDGKEESGSSTKCMSVPSRLFMENYEAAFGSSKKDLN